MYYKNGYPWFSIRKLEKPVNSEILNELIRLWKNINWGDNFENCRRPVNETAIFPDTRVVSWNPNLNIGNNLLASITEIVFNDIKELFDVQMKIRSSELSLLLPNGKIDWHHDRLKQSQFSTRIMTPLLNDNDVDYYFCNWSTKTPQTSVSFLAKLFLTDPIYSTKMLTGNYYMFNNRVPHQTISNNPLPRGMFTIDLIPEDYDLTIKDEFAPISVLERSEIEPPTI
jgi:hypothetical protein